VTGWSSTISARIGDSGDMGGSGSFA
jgi:hypothetical protein